MNPLKFFFRANIATFSLCCAQLFSINIQAVEFEITPMIGKTFSPDLVNANKALSLPTTDEQNIALSFAWKDSPTGQGQILVNYISRDFVDDINLATHSFETLYTHFNGVALFKERNYITTVGLGIGATYFKSDVDDVVYPSLTVAIGTRYEISSSLAFVTELRAYATFTDDSDTLFCENDSCLAHFDGAVWFDNQVSVGIAYRF